MQELRVDAFGLDSDLHSGGTLYRGLLDGLSFSNNVIADHLDVTGFNSGRLSCRVVGQPRVFGLDLVWAF
mgnify:CR=1 FL=1